MKKKLSVFLACALLLGMAACSKGGGETPSSAPAGSAAAAPSGSSAPAQPAESQGNMNAEGLPILKEPESFKIAVSKAVLCKNTFPEKECVIETEKATNVHIEWMEIPASGWKEKTNIMLASGDLPDAFLGGIDVSNNLSALAPLDDAIQQYAPAIRELFEQRPDVAKAVVAPDGKIHSLPIGDETYNNKIDRNLWINQKWLDQLGLAMPTTTEEFADVLRAFRSQDPNGNGQADEIPLSFQGTATIGNLFGAFGALDNVHHIVTIDGQAVFTPTADGFYEGLQWLHSLNAEGLLDPETFTMNEEQFNGKFKENDTLGAMLAFDPSIVVGAGRMGDFAAVLPLKGPDGKQMWNDTGSVGINGFSISTKCKSPEVLVRWYDYIRSDSEVALLWNRGPKDVGWAYAQDGKWKVNQEACPADIPYGQWRHTIAAAGSAPYFMQAEMAGPDGQEFTTPRDILKVATVESYLPYAYKSLPNGFDEVENANRRSMLLVDIDSYLKKFTSGSVLEGLDEKGWEEHLKACQSLKTAEYEQLCQNFVDRVEG